MRGLNAMECFVFVGLTKAKADLQEITDRMKPGMPCISMSDWEQKKDLEEKVIYLQKLYDEMNEILAD